MKYLAKYENERKKNELPRILVPAKITFTELSDLEVVVLRSLFNKGRFGEDFLRENYD